ncbi:hypothetical protein ACEPAG_265 [Sanghuangporus baumii]
MSTPTLPMDTVHNIISLVPDEETLETLTTLSTSSSILTEWATRLLWDTVQTCRGIDQLFRADTFEKYCWMVRVMRLPVDISQQLCDRIIHWEGLALPHLIELSGLPECGQNLACFRTLSLLATGLTSLLLDFCFFDFREEIKPNLSALLEGSPGLRNLTLYNLEGEHLQQGSISHCRALVSFETSLYMITADILRDLSALPVEVISCQLPGAGRVIPYDHNLEPTAVQPFVPHLANGSFEKLLKLSIGICYEDLLDILAVCCSLRLLLAKSPERETADSLRSVLSALVPRHSTLEDLKLLDTEDDPIPDEGPGISLQDLHNIHNLRGLKNLLINIHGNSVITEDQLTEFQPHLRPGLLPLVHEPEDHDEDDDDNDEDDTDKDDGQEPGEL